VRSSRAPKYPVGGMAGVWFSQDSWLETLFSVRGWTNLQSFQNLPSGRRCCPLMTVVEGFCSPPPPPPPPPFPVSKPPFDPRSVRCLPSLRLPPDRMSLLSGPCFRPFWPGDAFFLEFHFPPRRRVEIDVRCLPFLCDQFAVVITDFSTVFPGRLWFSCSVPPFREGPF